ncbi:MAG: TetR/AcrR family transcriptional regulator [Beijerinckiaceae bacterium]
MARPRAADYDEKRSAILKRSARLFAANGYDRTSMSEIALALGVSKALFYHYYRSKDDLLADIIGQHLEELVATAEAADDPALPAEQRLRSVIAAVLGCYRDADAEHKIQINHLSQLPEAAQADLKALERRLVRVVSGVVAALNPSLDRQRVTPLAMTIFGALNWKYMWFRDGGTLSEADYADMLVRLFAPGIRAETEASGVRDGTT